MQNHNSSLTRRLALGAYALLLVLVVCWEAWGAPLTPVARGFWVTIKLVPLLVPLYWLVRGNAQAHVLAALLVLLYFCDGIVTTYLGAKAGEPAQWGYGLCETLAAVIFIGAATFYARPILRHPPARAAE